jgi:hypothetical protein
VDLDVVEKKGCCRKETARVKEREHQKERERNIHRGEVVLIRGFV